MDWVSDWVGLPHEPLGRGPGYDCLGLYLAIYKARHGISLPDPRCTMLQAARDKTADQMRDRFSRIDLNDVQEGDALLFRTKGHLLHVGYALDKRDMIHIPNEGHTSVIECWRGISWFGKLEGAYRAN